MSDLVKSRLEALAKAPAPPEGLPVPVDDWTAMPVEERAQALQLWTGEVLESFGGVLKPDFPRIKMPGGGATTWPMPDGSAVKVIEAIVVYAIPLRKYWISEDLTGGRPDCESHDGRRPFSGHGPDGVETCTSCKLSRIGTSRKSGGSACKRVTATFLWQEGQLVPNYLPLPSTSVEIFEAFVTALVNSGRALTSVTIKLALERRMSRGNKPYSVAVPSEGRRLSWSEMKAAVGVREKFAEEMRRRAFGDDEVAEAVDDDAGTSGEPAPPRTDDDLRGGRPRG